MSVRKTCTDGARAVCKYGDQRCDHSWKATVKARGQRYPSVDIDEYAYRRGHLAHVRTEREALEWEAKIEADWIAKRDPREPPDGDKPPARTVAELLDEYLPVALDRLKVHPPVESEVRHIRAYFEDAAITELASETTVGTFMRELREGWRPAKHGEPQEPLEDGRGEASVNRMMARLRNFTNWCLAQHDPPIGHTPFHRHGIVIKTSAETQRTRRLFDWEEAALLAACDQVNDLDHHWAGGAIKRRILGALYAGARSSELDRVRIDHVNYRELTITLTKGKSRKERTLSVDPAEPLAAMLTTRRFLKAPTDFPFGDEDGSIVSHRTAWETVVLLAHGKITADGAGRDPERDALNLLAIDLHFHDLRRECASRWWERTKDIWRVSEWLGHGSIAMTQRYLALEGKTGLAADMAAQLGHQKPNKSKSDATEFRKTGAEKARTRMMGADGRGR